MYKINAKAFGETLERKKHNFKVEIKAPTFYDMVIKNEDKVYMRFLLDLQMKQRIPKVMGSNFCNIIQWLTFNHNIIS